MLVDVDAVASADVEGGGTDDGDAAAAIGATMLIGLDGAGDVAREKVLGDGDLGESGTCDCVRTG